MLHDNSSILKPEPSLRRLLLLLVLSLACAVIAVRGDVKSWDGSANGNLAIGAKCTVTNATAGPARFYELRKP